MRLSEIAPPYLPDRSDWMPQRMPVPFLYHATSEAAVASIQRHGILTRFYGQIHGQMAMHPPKPALYLSRRPKSNNLHAELFTRGPVVVLKIDASRLNLNEVYPDDFMYDFVADGELFTTAKSIVKALGCPPEQARHVLSEIENGDERTLPMILKPFWAWYLGWRRGGEIAYTANISPDLILGAEPY